MGDVAADSHDAKHLTFVIPERCLEGLEQHSPTVLVGDPLFVGGFLLSSKDVLVNHTHRISPFQAEQLMIAATHNIGDGVVYNLSKGFIAAQIAALRIFIENRIGDGVDQRVHDGVLPLSLLGRIFQFGDVLKGHHIHGVLLVLHQKDTYRDINEPAVTATKPAFEVFGFPRRVCPKFQPFNVFGTCIRIHIYGRYLHAYKFFNAVMKLLAGSFVGINHLAPDRVQPKQGARVFNHHAVKENFLIRATALGNVPKIKDQSHAFGESHDRGDGALNESPVLHFNLVENFAFNARPQLLGTGDKLRAVLDHRRMPRHQSDFLAWSHQCFRCQAPHFRELGIDVFGAAGKVDRQYAIVGRIQGIGQEGHGRAQGLDALFLSLVSRAQFNFCDRGTPQQTL